MKVSLPNMGLYLLCAVSQIQGEEAKGKPVDKMPGGHIKDYSLICKW